MRPASTALQAVLMGFESALAFQPGAVSLTPASVDALMHPEKVCVLVQYWCLSAAGAAALTDVELKITLSPLAAVLFCSCCCRADHGTGVTSALTPFATAAPPRPPAWQRPATLPLCWRQWRCGALA